MSEYRKKPVVIEAFKLGHDGMPDWFMDKLTVNEVTTHNVDDRLYGGPDYALITTLEGQMRAEFGDFIIRGVKGEIYPCKPDIFAQTYESAESRPAPEQSGEAAATQRALEAMVDAMRWWGKQEDGIPMEVAPAFNAAMLALGWSYSQQVDLDALSVEQSRETRDALEFRIKDAIAGIGNVISDPMWANHSEVSKFSLKKWHKVLNDVRAAMDRSALGRDAENTRSITADSAENGATGREG
jgi:hypothetical protein